MPGVGHFDENTKSIACFGVLNKDVHQIELSTYNYIMSLIDKSHPIKNYLVRIRSDSSIIMLYLRVAKTALQLVLTNYN